MAETTKIMGYDVLANPLSELNSGEEKITINTLNAYSYVVARRDKDFKKALLNSDVIVPDGFPVVVAARLLNGKKIQKIAGADIFFHYCQELNKSKGSCFFLGSSEATLAKIKERIAKDYPTLKAGFYSPPYKPVFSDSDNQAMIKAVNDFAPDAVFVGMTAPKQEKWAHKHGKELNTKVITSIGAVFDFYAGTVSRPSEFWIKLNLEWFIRMLKEPRRLWKRYLVHSPVFFFDMILFKLRILR